MKINKLLDIVDLDKVDQDELNFLAERRGFFKHAKQLSIKTAMAAIPAAVLSMMPRIVKAQSSSVVNVLNFALLLEYLERDFYKMGLEASGLIPASDREVFTTIYEHEAAHVEFLKSALGSSAGDVPVFDFTADGAYANAFSDYQTFLTLSQAFEDTGVRAYKGQAGNLQEVDDILTAALQIHSVEARHASEVRRLRGMRSGMMIKGWITNAESDGAPQPVYMGEDNTTHAGLDLNSIPSLSEYSMEALTEAFDEPLTFDQVFAIVKPFVLKGT